MTILCGMAVAQLHASGDAIRLGDPPIAIFVPAEYKSARLASVRSEVRKLAPDLYHVRWEFVPDAPQMVSHLGVRMRFQPNRSDTWLPARKEFHWIPNIKSKPEHVASDHAFRSPVVIIMAGGDGAALIPDLEGLEKRRPVSQYLDLQFPEGEAPFVDFGFANTEPDGHTYYRHSYRRWQMLAPETLSAFVIVQRATSREALLARVSAFFWDQYGRRYMRRTEPQTAPFARLAQYGYEMALRDLWVEGPKPGTGGITLTTLLSKESRYRGRQFPNDLWFHSWFNNARTAYGLYQWGKRLGNPDWMERGRSVMRLLIASPREAGLFSTIYIPGERRWQSSGQGGDANQYHLADNAWTALWLQRFASECESTAGADEMLGEFSRALLKLQHADGSFPGRVRKDTLVPDPALDHGAESALPLWFLADMLLRGKLSGTDAVQARAAVRKGLVFLRKHVVEPQRFEDFELFFSCSRKPLEFFDPITHMHGQNTLALQWCAEAFRAGYLLENRAEDLREGVFCLNLMNLYQQVWNPPYLDLYAFGGYGVMNTDAEWNDARQAQFAETNSNFYELTGDARYLERSVAAARAAFALVVMNENRTVAPRNFEGTPINHEVHGASAENYAHSGRNERAFQSGFHWGTGSALTTAIVLLNRFGTLYLDPAKRLAIGIDGVAVNSVQWNGTGADIAVVSLDQVGEIEGRIAGGRAGAAYEVRVNSRKASVSRDAFQVKLR